MLVDSFDICLFEQLMKGLHRGPLSRRFVWSVLADLRERARSRKLNRTSQVDSSKSNSFNNFKKASHF
jgi:hypothetical protein